MIPKNGAKVDVRTAVWIETHEISVGEYELNGCNVLVINSKD